MRADVRIVRVRGIWIAGRRESCGQQGAAELQLAGAMPLGEEAELADAHQAGGQDVEQERRRNSIASRVMSLVRAWWA